MRPIVHGTSNAYGNRGCRCDPCKRAWSEYMRSRRDKTNRELATIRAARPAPVRYYVVGDLLIDQLEAFARVQAQRNEWRERALQAEAHGGAA